MRLSFITPAPWIKKFGSQSDFILALANVLPSQAGTQGSIEYQNEILKTELPVILDNGLFENDKPEGIQSLMKKAIEVRAELFFAPDFLYDGELTAIELDHAIKLRNYYHYHLEIGAVVQAKGPEAYKRQLLQFNDNLDVKLIGLSILSIPESFDLEVGKYDIAKSRIYLMKWMIEKVEEGVVWKDMHLLGVGDSYEDVIFATKYCPWIVSSDSSCAFQSGYMNKRLNENLEVPGGKVPNKVEFGLMYLTDSQKEDVQYNIDIIKRVIKQHESN